MVQILIRSPSVSTPDDFTVDAEPEHTIAELKAAIEKTHDASPPARHMRVIWRGRILHDSSIVGDLYEESDDPFDLQTVHFVLNAPAAEGATSRPQKTAPVIVKGKSRADISNPGTYPGNGKMNASYDSGADSSSSSSHGSRTQSLSHNSKTASGASVTPLGSPFQYVLVDGVPYLMEIKEPNADRSSGSAEDAAARGSGRILLKAYADLVTRQSALEGRLRRVLEPNGRTAEATGEEGGNTGANGGAGAVREARARANQNRQADNADRANDNENRGGPLPNVLRGFGMDAVWNVGWVLLRVLLLVVVLAHDASLERMAVLVLLVAGIMAFRSAWMQQIVRQLNTFNNYTEERANENAAEDRRRDYSTIEKARALIIALVTSLIPSEPLQAPAMDG
ncbi:hypothetical protein LPJ81_002961 [Coemansia sp. IMI 209127]|nr:hypothetical protein LPJ81_002961 [Coemansia sp. IMI 209127]